MKTKVFLLVVSFITFFTKATWGQQIDSNDVSYLSKVSLKQRVSEESFLFNYPTGYELTANKFQLPGKSKERDKFYKKGLRALSKPEKALRYFIQGVEKFGDRAASYQVGHYYCFGIFDTTGNATRKGLSPIDAKKGLSFLNYANPNKLSKLYADKDSWIFDPRRAVYSGIIKGLSDRVYRGYTDCDGEKYDSQFVESLIKEYAGKVDFNFERFFVDNYEQLNDGDPLNIAFFGESDGIFYRISRLSFLNDSILGNAAGYQDYLGSQYILLGFEYLNKKDEARALFNFAKAGYAGNSDGFRMVASMINSRWSNYIQRHYKGDYSKGAGELYGMVRNLTVPKDDGFYPEYKALLEEAKERVDIAHEQFLKEWKDKEAAKLAAKKEKRATFWNNIAQALAVGVATAAQGIAIAAQQQQYAPAYVPTTTYSTGFSADYYSSPAYLNQVQARANYSMANYQAQLQRIGQQALANNQQMINRSSVMFKDMMGWSIRFRGDNGREPTDFEKSQWVKQNYPDMYPSYIQAQTAQYERKSGGDNSEREDNQKVSNTYDCSYCGGSGRLLQEEETLSFGLATEKEYKCNECGKWKYKGKTHRHYDCTHCKGKGKVTFN